MNTTRRIPIRAYHGDVVLEFQYATPVDTLNHMIERLCTGIGFNPDHLFFLIPTEPVRTEVAHALERVSHCRTISYYPCVITVEQFVFYLASDDMPKGARLAIYDTPSVLKELKSLPHSNYELAVNYLNQHLEGYYDCPLHRRFPRKRLGEEL